MSASAGAVFMRCELFTSLFDHVYKLQESTDTNTTNDMSPLKVQEAKINKMLSIDSVFASACRSLHLRCELFAPSFNSSLC